MNNENVPNADIEPTLVTNDESPKRPYTAPRLKEYGDIRELTLGTGTSGLPDTAGVSSVVTG